MYLHLWDRYDRWKDTWFDDEEKLKSFLHPAINDSQSINVDGIVYIAGHRREINCFPQDIKVPMVVAYATNKNNVYPSIIIDDEKLVMKLASKKNSADDI